MQRVRLVPACFLLPGQVERLARMLSGLLAASLQTTDLAQPCDRGGNVLYCHRARADTFAYRSPLEQRVPLREVS